MVEFSGTWTADEVGEFLRDVTIPVRLGVRRPDGSPWLVPLWYRYRNGQFECATGANADIVDFLRTDPEVAFDVSTNEIPYRGIRGVGTATITPDSDKAVLRSLLNRYLGGTETDLARRLLDGDRAEVRIEIEPAEVFSWDFSRRMQAGGG